MIINIQCIQGGEYSIQQNERNEKTNYVARFMSYHIFSNMYIKNPITACQSRVKSVLTKISSFFEYADRLVMLQLFYAPIIYAFILN